jgi:hypothetical protein
MKGVFLLLSFGTAVSSGVAMVLSETQLQNVIKPSSDGLSPEAISAVKKCISHAGLRCGRIDGVESFDSSKPQDLLRLVTDADAEPAKTSATETGKFDEFVSALTKSKGPNSSFRNISEFCLARKCSREDIDMLAKSFGLSIPETLAYYGVSLEDPSEA